MFSSRVTVPPPQAMTSPLSAASAAQTSISYARKAASPRVWIHSAADKPLRCAISASRSQKRRPHSAASSFPTVVLPQPGIPMRT